MWKVSGIALIVVSFLFGSDYSQLLEKHFKKAENKPLDQPKLRNVDFIYVINLDPRPEKWEGCLKELEPYGIVPYRFSAVNGWELSLESLNSLGIQYHPSMKQNLMGTMYLPQNGGEALHEIMETEGQNYYCHCMSRGAIGIVLSHLSILQDAYDSGYETIWVMEDDIQVHQSIGLISDRIDELDQMFGKEGWDILFTDKDTKDDRGRYIPCLSHALHPAFDPYEPQRFAERIPVGNNFTRVGARYGAYSMIIRKSGMKKILDFFKEYHIFLPYDMQFYLPDDIVLYAVRDEIVSFKVGSPSDNGSQNYKK